MGRVAGEPRALVAKCLDGHERGLRWLLPVLLAHLGWVTPETLARWQGEVDPPVVRNVAGRVVGEVEVVLTGPVSGTDPGPGDAASEPVNGLGPAQE